MASMLVEELLEEILLRIPPDEPAHLVRASVVCKAWHSIASNGSFLRRYRRFHGTPPLLGYICNDKKDSTIRFIPTTSVAASPFWTHKGRTPSALDCRHGRVLIETKNNIAFVDGLIVWDPVTGTRHNLSLPYSNFPYLCAGAVLCVKDGCDHLDCHSGPFDVVIVGTSFVDGNLCTWASMYSSKTGAWTGPTNNIMNRYFNDGGPSLFIRDVVYFTIVRLKRIIIKYDLHKHVLSVINFPTTHFWPILMKGDDGGLGFADMMHNCIHMWSRQAGINGIEKWVKYRVMEVGTQVLRNLLCRVDGANTILIDTKTGIFTVDLESGQATKIGERATSYDHRPILPYMSFYTPKY